MGLEVVGIDPDGLAKRLKRGAGMLQRQFRLSQTEQSLGVTRIRSQGGPKMRLGICRPGFFQKD